MQLSDTDEEPAVVLGYSRGGGGGFGLQPITPPTPQTDRTLTATGDQLRSFTPEHHHFHYHFDVPDNTTDRPTARILTRRTTNLGPAAAPTTTCVATTQTPTTPQLQPRQPLRRRINSLSPIMTSSRADLKLHSVNNNSNYPMSHQPVTHSLHRYSMPPPSHQNRAAGGKFTNVDYFCRLQSAKQTASDSSPPITVTRSKSVGTTTIRRPLLEESYTTTTINDNSLCSLVLLPPSPFKTSMIGAESPSSSNNNVITRVTQPSSVDITSAATTTTTTAASTTTSSNRAPIMINNSSERKPTIKRV